MLRLSIGCSARCLDANDELNQLPWELDFRKSRWFTRGWTLKELLAPGSVEFFSREGKQLGDKRTLERQIHEITGIAIPALRGTPLSQFGIDERLSWAENRQTTRKEDKAYSLLGIFDVFMSLIYAHCQGLRQAPRAGVRNTANGEASPVLQAGNKVASVRIYQESIQLSGAYATRHTS